ncbi:MAG: glucose-1-phosphate adenylyltransferase, partial [Deltaproteobacteria bacterium]|nr:glucose-1-phosphate adenylyltransferase [Deltaproteobacteria bacterium]
VDSMGVLTGHRSMAAVPFGGMSRVIDFVLTNLSESGVERVGILSQYRPSSLMKHVGIGRHWDYNGRTRELSFLPPFQGTGELDWYRGTADAVQQNLHFIEKHAARDVMILSGDHVYRMDYGPLVDYHRKKNADLTMVFKHMDCGRPSRFGVGVLGDDGRVTGYSEKPEVPESDLASLTIYVFRTEALKARLLENAKIGATFQLYDEVIPRMVAEDRVYGYVFDGGWEYVRPLRAWYDLHLRMVKEGGIGVPMDHVRTNLEDQGLGDAPPAAFTVTADVHGSRVTPGCRVAGKVRSSVLFGWVTVEEGAEVRDSVILNGTHIGKGARVVRSVVDKQCVIGDGACLEGGYDLVALGKYARIEGGRRLGAGDVVAPVSDPPDGTMHDRGAVG